MPIRVRKTGAGGLIEAWEYDNNAEARRFFRYIEDELDCALRVFADASRQYAITSTGSRVHARQCRVIANPEDWTAEELAMDFVEFARLLNEDEARAWLAEDDHRGLCAICRPQFTQNAIMRRAVGGRPG